MQFNLLRNDPNLKHLTTFFKILTSLWTMEDYIPRFDDYISKLNPIIEEILSMDDDTLRIQPSVSLQMIKLFHILKGISLGLTSSKNFGVFFDWFYPEYFRIINKALTVYIDNDNLTIVVFKFLAELLNNRFSRHKSDFTWNINGLILFREIAKITIDYLKYTDHLSLKSVGNDLYTEKLKIFQSLLILFQNAFTGFYINFAICDFYNDDTFL